ncbi:DnaJ-domain-containing protein [Bimuria novae-zelandiae CBS 107.79]|uniref:DnaJ-domain-containing protein n=1 Tax=Bimuria novae-zelandiae CBS 107.79 TaxID=1447943 RepID=A0A6A5UK66_9PLEO|nr:DnaJ-domain-containing protein [Bimuria novae-zelandiae CBS 107.79]
MPTHYEALRVPAFANLDELKQSYHDIARTCHPDKTKHLPPFEREERERRFKDANNAWEVLKDDSMRAEYDQTLAPLIVRQKAPDPPPMNEHFETRGVVCTFGKYRPPPPPAPNNHPLICWQEVFGKWYCCPVTEDAQHTTINFANDRSWNLTIQLLRCFILNAKPIVPQLDHDTSTAIEIVLQGYRDPFFSRVFDNIGGPGQIFCSRKSVPNVLDQISWYNV